MADEPLAENRLSPLQADAASAQAGGVASATSSPGGSPLAPPEAGSAQAAAAGSSRKTPSGVGGGVGSSVAGQLQPSLPTDDAKTVISREPPIATPLVSLQIPRAEQVARQLVGERLGHFQLDEFIGGGGMGAVFRATDTALDRTVAVKVVSGASHDEEALKRFRNEAQNAARLDHPNIARVYYVGFDRGWHYIVFEYVQGVNIRDLVVQRGPLPIDEIISYTVQVAAALEHAWQRDVVHRDIKPSNVLVTADGVVKLVDMGLARFQQMDTTDELTASGVTLGTFDYISPEQARDPRVADVRSDLYSLGCTMFFMLTGRPPFAEGTVLQKLLSHSSEPPPDPRQFRDDVPDELARIVLKLLAKNPSDRYQKPSQLIAELVMLADKLAITLQGIKPAVVIAPAQTSDRYRELLPWLAAVALVLIAALLIEWGSGSAYVALERPGLPIAKNESSSRPGMGSPTRRSSGETAAGDSIASESGISETHATPNKESQTTPGMSAHGISAPGASAPGGSAAGVSAPGVSAPAVSAGGGTVPGGASGAGAGSSPTGPMANGTLTVAPMGAPSVGPMSVGPMPGGLNTSPMATPPGSASPLTPADSAATASSHPPATASSPAGIGRSQLNGQAPTPPSHAVESSRTELSDTVTSGPSTTGTPAVVKSTGSEGRVPESLTSPVTPSQVRRIVVAPEPVQVPADALWVSSLQAALAQAATMEQVEVIELQFNGPQLSPPWQLAIANRLEIRAAEGYRPAIWFQPSATLLAADRRMISVRGGDTVLRGIDLVVELPKQPAEGWSVFSLDEIQSVELHEATITVINGDMASGRRHDGASVFEILAPRARPRMDMEMTMGTVASASTMQLPPVIHLNNVAIRGQLTVLYLSAAQPLHFSWSNGLLVTNYRLLEMGGTSDSFNWDAELQIRLDHVTAVVDQGLARVQLDQSAPKLLDTNFEINDCILVTAAESPLLEYRGVTSVEQAEKTLKFRGDSNFYPTRSSISVPPRRSPLRRVRWRLVTTGGQAIEYGFDQKDSEWYEEKSAKETVLWKSVPPSLVELPAHRHTKLHYELESGVRNPARGAGFLTEPNTLPDFPALVAPIVPTDSNP